MKRKFSDEQLLDALKAARGLRAEAARRLGISTQGLFRHLDRMRVAGVEIPESPYDGSHASIAGTSTLYGPNGEEKLRWVKTRAGEPSAEDVAIAIRDALTGIPKAAPVPAPKQTQKDLLAVYPIGDQHVGMYSWAEETGADYDLKIAERLLTSAVAHLVEQTPAADEAVIVDVGDFTHYDTIRTETVRSHNTLDSDSRYHAMIRVALRLVCACVDRALQKHRKVTLIAAPGNHNDMGAAWMIEALALYYARNPRVHVMAKAGKFFYYEFGKCLLGVTHGDTGKPEKLAGVMAADQPQAWGRTAHRHWLTGHVHNKAQIEMQGVLWETFRTLAPGDAWSFAAAYRSSRSMESIVYHHEHGEVGRHMFKLSMLDS